MELGSFSPSHSQNRFKKGKLGIRSIHISENLYNQVAPHDECLPLLQEGYFELTVFREIHPIKNNIVHLWKKRVHIIDYLCFCAEDYEMNPSEFYMGKTLYHSCNRYTQHCPASRHLIFCTLATDWCISLSIFSTDLSDNIGLFHPDIEKEETRQTSES